MNYWDNPLIQVKASNSEDLFAEHLTPEQCVYYHPALPLNQVHQEHLIDEFCEFANRNNRQDILKDLYWLANLVKVNMWTVSMREVGILKPLLLYIDKHQKLKTLTGSTRMLCAQLIPEITHVPVMISVHQANAALCIEQKFKRMHTFDRFVTYIGATDNQTVSLRFTNDPNNYGLYWFEYNARDPLAVAPDDEWCLNTIRNYLDTNPDVEITPEWFLEPHFAYDQ